MCLCQCIFYSIEIHNIKLAITTDMEFVYKVCQVMAESCSGVLPVNAQVFVNNYKRPLIRKSLLHRPQFS